MVPNNTEPNGVVTLTRNDGSNNKQQKKHSNRVVTFAADVKKHDGHGSRTYTKRRIRSLKPNGNMQGLLKKLKKKHKSSASPNKRGGSARRKLVIVFLEEEEEK